MVSKNKKLTSRVGNERLGINKNKTHKTKKMSNVEKEKKIKKEKRINNNEKRIKNNEKNKKEKRTKKEKYKMVDLIKKKQYVPLIWFNQV